MKIFENKRLKGAVSIFLVIILIPTMVLCAVLIDGSRMSSAMAMTQEATDLAAASVLASYNQELKDQFGLFALNEKDQAKLESIYKESLEATLLAQGMSGDDEYSERLWGIMKTVLTGQKSYAGESFLNLYDFQVEECKVEPLYSLANQDVLESQMVEYAKFRGIYVMTDRMDIFSELGNAQNEAKKNEVTSDVMEHKMQADEENGSADQALARLYSDVKDLNTKMETLERAQKSYLESLEAKMEEIRIGNTDTEDELTESQSNRADSYESSQRALGKAAEDARKQAHKVYEQADKAKQEVEKAIERLETFKGNNQGKASDNESVTSMITDANDNITLYQSSYLPGIQKLLDDPVLRSLGENNSLKADLENKMDEIEEAITQYIDELEEMQNETEEEGGSEDESGEGSEEEDEVTEYYYYYLSSSESTTEIGEAMRSRGAGKSYEPAIKSFTNDFISVRWDAESVNPVKKYEGKSSDKINKDFASSQSGNTGSSDTNSEGEAEQGKVEDAVYNSRPSKTWNPDNGKSGTAGFYNESGDLTASKNILNQGKHSMILDIGETVRDDVLGYTYMFGTFKTRLTGVKKFTSEGMSSSDKDSFYMPKWRYAHPEGELDMRFAPKRDRDTVLRSEIEYLVYGNQSDVANETAVYATIFAERLANNLAVMYMHKKVINPSCHAAAAAASAATLGTIPEPVFFWIFLTAWATAETVIEMDYLISGGYKIPLIKTTENILLSEFPDASGDGLIGNYGKTGIFVSYEDYLLLLLMIKGKEKRIMRTADLIEMNMKKAGQTDFTMAEAYTYLHADTNLSIRYLFGNVTPFQSTYEKGGYTGRMKFSNTIYQGY